MKEREKLIVDHMDLVKHIARSIWRKYPRHFEFDDFFQAGMIGLIDAANRYDSTMKIKFKTFANIRIAGSIIDQLREESPLSRYDHDRMKKIEYARHLLKINGKNCSNSELFKMTDIPIDEIDQILLGRESIGTISIDEIEDFNAREKKSLFNKVLFKTNSLDILVEKEVSKTIRESFECLKEKEKLVLEMYFYKDMYLREIGEVLFITESRVNQIIKSAVKKLRIWFVRR